MAGQPVHHFTSACQQPCCSELCACRQKGPERAMGGQRGLACAVRSELEPVAVVVDRAPMVSFGPVNKLALCSPQSHPFRWLWRVVSLSFSLLYFLVTFDLKPLLSMCCAHNCAVTFKTQSCKACTSVSMHDSEVGWNDSGDENVCTTGVCMTTTDSPPLSVWSYFKYVKTMLNLFSVILTKSVVCCNFLYLD